MDRRTITVVVAEDELVTRSGVVHLLRSGGLDVVAEASQVSILSSRGRKRCISSTLKHA
jgi:CheY-like chemotaxis protein